MIAAAAAGSAVGTTARQGKSPAPKGPPPGMSERQKKKWQEQQDALQKEKEQREKLKNNPVAKDMEDKKRHEEALERGVDYNYYKRGKPGKGGKRQVGNPSTGSGRGFEGGCGASGSCEK
jgi:hypothetical protein